MYTESRFLKEYVIEQTKTFKFGDAYLLGQMFGLDPESIDEVIREHHATKGQQAALAVYVEIERRSSFVNDSFADKVIDALQNLDKPRNEEGIVIEYIRLLMC